MQTSPPVSISAEELSARYRENESAADEDYSGQTLFVSGTVMDIEQEEVGHPVILFGGPGNALLARAELSPASRAKAIGLNEGDQVVIRCNGITKMIDAPLLLNCDL